MAAALSDLCLDDDHDETMKKLEEPEGTIAGGRRVSERANASFQPYLLDLNLIQ